MEGRQNAADFAVDTILVDIVKILEDMTADWETGFAGAIGPETYLVADLGFGSVDVVELIVSIEEHFNRPRIAFQELLMTADGRYIDDLRVSELVSFLYTQLNSPQLSVSSSRLD